MSLVIDGVHKAFVTKSGTQHVLRGIDLEVQAGEFVAIIGHSGCGKSTLLNAVGGLVTPDGGAITLDGARVTEPGPDRAIVFQSYSLLPWMTIEANVVEAVKSARPDRPKQRNRDEVEHYLKATNLWQHRHKRPGQVSGGMRQRAAVARAFAVGPKVLLLDEPFGALDALTRGQLQSRLVDLWTSDSGTETVLMVTHGIDEAIYLADRIVVMANAPHPSVAEIVDVPLPRPRDKAALVADATYIELREHLERLLQEELVVPEDDALAV